MRLGHYKSVVFIRASVISVFHLRMNSSFCCGMPDMWVSGVMAMGKLQNARGILGYAIEFLGASCGNTREIRGPAISCPPSSQMK